MKLPIPPERITEMRDWLWTGAEQHGDQRCKDALALFDFLRAYSRTIEASVHEAVAAWRDYDAQQHIAENTSPLEAVAYVKLERAMQALAGFRDDPTPVAQR